MCERSIARVITWTRARASLYSRSLIADTRGSIAITFALASTCLVMAIGCAIDYSRATSLRASLQAVTDSAALTQVRQAAVLSDANLRTATQNQPNAAFPYEPATITRLTRQELASNAGGTMARYFFHIHDGESMPDNGIGMPNADEACAQAVVSGSNASPEGCVAKLPEAR